MDPQPPIPMTSPQEQPPLTAVSAAATTEPIENHIAKVANPTPQQATTTQSHPPYAEMITAAITGLKERNGSSRKAIAKYIDRVYTNLPSTHSALLTHHLKRLKNSGQLLMVKHSYKLPPPPRSAPPPPLDNNAPPSHTLGPIGPQAHNQFAVGPAPVLPKRKPGRPPKPKPAVLTQPHNTTLPPPVAAHNTVVPPPPPPLVAQNYGSDAVFASLGLADGPVATPPAKRRPGRPRKVDSAGPHQPRPAAFGKSGPKRRPGRPPKNWAGPNSVAHVGSVSGKPRGRPKKGASAAVNSPVNGQPKRRGRRPKSVLQAPPLTAVPPAAVVAPVAEASAAVPRAVMVPYAQGPDAAVPVSLPHAPVPVPVPVAVNGVPPPAAGKRRGRPPRANGGPRKPTGKPVGRPKKNASSHEPSQHLDSFINLKRKLEYLQLRIKQTVSVLKPAIEGGTSASAMGALQQLEELATVGINEFEGQQPVQQF